MDESVPKKGNPYIGGKEVDPQGQNVGWKFLGRWFLATVIGLVLGLIVAIVLSYAIVNQFHPEETNLILGLCVGAAVGFAQVLAVRRVLSLKWKWMLGVIAGMGVPYTIAVLFDEAWFGAIRVSEMWQIPIVIVTGALAGKIQVGVLACHTLKAQWWIWVSTVTWGVTWLVSFPLDNYSILVAPLVYGGLSGALLIWLIRTSPSSDVA